MRNWDSYVGISNWENSFPVILWEKWLSEEADISEVNSPFILVTEGEILEAKDG